MLTQFWIYLKGVFTPFDLPGTDAHGPLFLGRSYQSNADVKDVIFSDLPATALLVFGAVIVWMAVAIPTGIISAIRQRSLLDRTTMVTTLVFISAPVFWLGLVALYLFAQDVGIIPIFPGIGSYAECRHASSPNAARCCCRGRSWRRRRRRSTPAICARR